MKSSAWFLKSSLNWPVELSMMRWTSSLALLKSSDISVTTLCRAAAAYSARRCCSAAWWRWLITMSTLSVINAPVQATARPAARTFRIRPSRQRRRSRTGSLRRLLGASSLLSASSVSASSSSTGLGLGRSASVRRRRLGFGRSAAVDVGARCISARRLRRPGPACAAGSRALWHARRQQPPPPRRPLPPLPRRAPVRRPRRPTDQDPAAVRRRGQRRSPTRGA